jgi:lipoyl synthase
MQEVVMHKRLHASCEEGADPNGRIATPSARNLPAGVWICIRSYAFRQVNQGQAVLSLHGAKAKRVAEAVAVLGLSCVVLTAVTRNDLTDHDEACSLPPLSPP